MNNDDKMVIDRIFELLNQKEIKPSKMADDLKFSSGLTSQWKSYLQKPSTDKIKLMAPYLNVSISYLLKGSEEPNVTQIVARRIKEIRKKENPVIDDEVWGYMQELYKEKIMFKTGKKVTKGDIEAAINLLEFLSKNNNE